jgi:hypothetical protein
MAVTPEAIGYVTGRGGIRVTPCAGLRILAYDTLSGDGETWGQTVAFCRPRAMASARGYVCRIGADSGALRAEDHDAVLYDLGVGVGAVAMHVRTHDAALIAALDECQGKKLLGVESAGLTALFLQRHPNRVLSSPAGRIEVYAPIPPADGKSPSGPHTHLLPKLIASGRTHSANAPIPEGLQPVLMMHPRSPWRDVNGQRTPFHAEHDEHFEAMLVAYGMEEDWLVRREVEKAVNGGLAPGAFSPPRTRRGRAQMRITLRRLAHRLGNEALSQWRALYDPGQPEGGEPAAVGHP